MVAWKYVVRIGGFWICFDCHTGVLGKLQVVYEREASRMTQRLWLWATGIRDLPVIKL